MRTFLRGGMFFLLALVFGQPAFACGFDSKDGLKVGLVLSGGGAKASTQVGVLQVLDELEIPVHCITGTSMGSVVGSFYAAGYSANEIGDMLVDNDWGAIFRGNSPRRDKSFVEKEREESYFSGNVAGVGKDGLKLPGGLSSMRGLKMYYRQILSNIPMQSSFDDLEIPFRAIATDLQTGEKKAFSEGDLVESILASMAVPGVFAPREIDGRLYVDGGISSNLPIEAAQNMGADIIIAIDVSVPPEAPRPDISVAGTALQITTIVVWRGVQRERARLKDGDLLIQPNTINIGTAAYERSAEGIAAGHKMALGLKDMLLEIKAKAAPSKRQKTAPKPLFATSEFKIINHTTVNDALIRNRYLQGKNHEGNVKIQNRRLRDLASFGGFGEVEMGYSNGAAVLTVDKNELGRNLLQVGINATNDFEGSSSYSILARLTRKPLSSRGGDFSLSGEFGTDIGLSAELYQPLGAGGRFFVQPEVFLRWELRKINVLNIRVGDFRARKFGFRGRAGREIGKWAVLALEGGMDTTRLSEIVSIFDSFQTTSADRANIGVYFATDTLDRNDWPSSGHRIRMRAKRTYELVKAQNRPAIDTLDISWLSAFQLSDFGLLLNARYGETSNKNGVNSSLEIFSLGGFRQLGSFSDRSLPAQSFTYGSLEVFHRLTQTGKLVDLPVYVGIIGETARLPLSFFDIEQRANVYAGSIYIGADTPLGPLFLGGAYGSGSTTQFFFKFGRTF
jgi:NTE family protein